MKINTQFGLFKARRFLALFLTQFCGAFNDNLFKSALIILITFRLAEQHNLNAQVLVTIVNGLFILPFFLFSATAGQLSDKYEKSFLIRITKIAEIILMAMTAWAFMATNLWMLITLLVLMGAQSAFFGPLKYSILPQLLCPEELLAGNGLVNAATYIAILSGTLCGGLLILSESGRLYIGAGVVLVAVLGYAASLFIPKAEAQSPHIRIDWLPPRATKNMLSHIRPHKAVFRAMMGVSWFWLLGSVFLAQFPGYAKNVLGGNERVSTLFLVLFSIGVGLGSTFCNKLLKGEISAKLAPVGSIGMSLSIAALYISSVRFERAAGLMGLFDFVSRSQAWWLMLSLIALAAFGGIFSVPFYAIAQAKSPDGYRARVVACTNILDSFGMVMATVAAALLLLAGVSVINVFLIFGVVNLMLAPVFSKTLNNGGPEKN